MCASETAGVSGPKPSVRLLTITPACTMALTGCLVGPNYHRPTVETPSAWKEQPPQGWKTATPEDEIGKGNWWTIFNDSELDELEQQAIAANQNLQAAAQRVLQARATALATRSNFYPNVSAGFSADRARNSGSKIVGTNGVQSSLYDANLFSLAVQASYEVDLGGQIRRSVESAQALTQVSVANYENVLLQLKSDVASFYIMTHYIDQEMVILRNNITLQQ